jgi:hypothetical protein
VKKEEKVEIIKK